MIRTNRLLVVFNSLLATILVLVLVQFTPSVANADSKAIVACADKKTGALRIAYKACSKRENRVTWGVTGPQGATGSQGASGANGAQGIAGIQGAAGDSFIKAFGEVDDSPVLTYFNATGNVTMSRLVIGEYQMTVEGIDLRYCVASASMSQDSKGRFITTSITSPSIFKVYVTNKENVLSDGSFSFLVLCIS